MEDITISQGNKKENIVTIYILSFKNEYDFAFKAFLLQTYEWEGP